MGVVIGLVGIVCFTLPYPANKRYQGLKLKQKAVSLIAKTKTGGKDYIKSALSYYSVRCGLPLCSTCFMQSTTSHSAF